MSKLLIFNFDGTSNEPSDAVQDTNYKGAKEDDNITNILKFHLMLGGTLLPKKSPDDHESNWEDTDQRVFYYQGVGTYGSRLKRLFNAAVSPKKSDVATILKMALKDFKESYQIGDKALVTGFSRGAALARRFVALIETDHMQKAKSNQDYANLGKYIYEALYDTVASIGLPNMSKSNRPDFDVVFENGHSLPINVKNALHCVSLDDKRHAFQPTLMNYQQDIVHEVWFAGAHSDVGGGYYRDRLSDMSLEYFLGWVADNVPEARYRMPTENELEDVVPEGVDYKIGIDDLTRNPSAFGKNHQQDRFFVLDWLTLTDRLCCVIENDKPSSRRPLVHWSVAARIHSDGDYRPKSLKNVKQTVVYADGRTKDCNGIAKHIESPRCDLRYLEKPNGQPWDKFEEVTVFASHQHNYSGLMLEKGGTYQFKVERSQQWNIANNLCGPEGCDHIEQYLGLSTNEIALQKPFRRVPDADWFCLCGCVTDDDDYAFKIGNGPVEVKIKKSGEFLPFANDKRTHYGNNDGKVIVVIQRVS